MTPTPNNMNTPSPEVFQPADTGRMRAWPFVFLALGLLLFIFSMLFDLFDVGNKYRDVWFALSTAGGLVCAVSVVCLLAVNGSRMPLAGKVGAVALLLFMIAPSFVPYIEVERLTEHYGVQFEDGYKELGYFKECDYHKVLRYEGEGPYVYSSSSFATGMLEYLDDDEAAVLYVVDGHAAELLVVFEQAQDGWKMKSWDAIWSKSGSADDFTWPMYR